MLRTRKAAHHRPALPRGARAGKWRLKKWRMRYAQGRQLIFAPHCHEARGRSEVSQTKPAQGCEPQLPLPDAWPTWPFITCDVCAASARTLPASWPYALPRIHTNS